MDAEDRRTVVAPNAEVSVIAVPSSSWCSLTGGGQDDARRCRIPAASRGCSPCAEVLSPRAAKDPPKTARAQIRICGPRRSRRACTDRGTDGTAGGRVQPSVFSGDAAAPVCGRPRQAHRLADAQPAARAAELGRGVLGLAALVAVEDHPGRPAAADGGRHRQRAVRQVRVVVLAERVPEDRREPMSRTESR